MEKDVTPFHVTVATFGGEEWRALAEERAIPSVYAAMANTDCPTTFTASHGKTLHEARNKGAEDAPEGAWLIFVDADDTLDVNYIKAMSDKVSDLLSIHYVVQPATRTVKDGQRVDQPMLIPPRESILAGNHCVVGSAVNKTVFEEVGGFGPDPFWEDWVLWIDCWYAGADFTSCQEAIYEVWQSSNSRNKVSDREAQSLFRRVVDRYRGKIRRQN